MELTCTDILILEYRFGLNLIPIMIIRIKHHQMMGDAYGMHGLANPYSHSHQHAHAPQFLDDHRLGTLSEPGANFADLNDVHSEVGKPMNKGLKGLSASVPDLSGLLHC